MVGFRLVNIVDGSAGQLTTGPIAYGLSPNTTTKINSASLTNTSGNATTASVWLVPAGDVPADEFLLIANLSILAGQTYNCPELVNKNMVAGTAIAAMAGDANALSFIVSGIQVA